VIADASVSIDATVLLVGQGTRADALARRLSHAGLDLERVHSSEVAEIARVSAPDLIVVVDEGGRGKHALALLENDASNAHLPVLVIRETSLNAGRAAASRACVAELAFDGGPVLCAQRIHLLIATIADRGLAGRTLQQALDMVTGAVRAGAPSSVESAQDAPGVVPTRSGRVARGATLLGAAAPHASENPARPSRVSFPGEPSSATREPIPLSALAASAGDRPIVATTPPARRSIPPADHGPPTRPHPVFAPTMMLDAEPGPAAASSKPAVVRAKAATEPLAAARATSRTPAVRMSTAPRPPRPRIPRVALVAAAAAASVGVGIAALLANKARDGAEAAAATASIATAIAGAAPHRQELADERAANAARADSEVEGEHDDLAGDLPTDARLSRSQKAAIADRHVGAGHRLLKRRALRAARAAYLEALRVLPGYPRALAGLVRVELKREDGAEALRMAKRLTAVQPRRGNNQLLLGDAWALHGNLTLARAAWRQAIRYGNTTAHRRLKAAARDR
jgi:hypothetical protein